MKLETKSTGIKGSYEPDTRKYYGQQCQDDKTNGDFRVLHHEIVGMIIRFCKEHNIIADEFHISADGLAESIPYGSWQAPTDSSFTIMKFSEEYKDVFHHMKKIVTKEEGERIKNEQEPYLFSM